MIQSTVAAQKHQRSTKMIKMGSNQSFLQANLRAYHLADDQAQQTPWTDITSPPHEQEVAVDEENRLLNAIAMNTPSAEPVARNGLGLSAPKEPIESVQKLYRFEWFRVLICLVLLTSLGIALGIIFLFSFKSPRTAVITHIATFVLLFLALPIIWAFACVISQLRIACQGGHSSANVDDDTRHTYSRAIRYTWIACIAALAMALTSAIILLNVMSIVV